MIIGDLMRKQRKAVGLKLSQVAQAIPCSISTVSRIESGELLPSADYVVAFLRLEILGLNEQQRKDINSIWGQDRLEKGRNEPFGQDSNKQQTLNQRVKANILGLRQKSLHRACGQYIRFLAETCTNASLGSISRTCPAFSHNLNCFYVQPHVHTTLATTQPNDHRHLNTTLAEASELVNQDVGQWIGSLEGVILVGDLGVGKTALLKHLVLELTEKRLSSIYVNSDIDINSLPDTTTNTSASIATGIHTVLNRLPVLIPLRAYAEQLAKEDIPLEHFVADYYRRQNLDLPLVALLTQLRQAGRLLLLLDGIDEIDQQYQRWLVADRVSKLFAFYRQFGNKLVLTCRPHVLHEISGTLNNLNVCHLKPFSLSDIHQFHEHWKRDQQLSLGSTASKGIQSHQSQFESLLQDADFASLAKNPLMLTVLLRTLVHVDSQMPEGQLTLIGNCLMTLLTHWNRHHIRSITRPQRILNILARLAVLMVTQSNVTEANLEASLLVALQQQQTDISTSTTHNLIQRIIIESGLLRHRAGVGLEFAEPAFTRYLLACGIVDIAKQNPDAAIAVMQKLQSEPSWQKTILYIIARVAATTLPEEISHQLYAATLSVN